MSSSPHPMLAVTLAPLGAPPKPGSDEKSPARTGPAIATTSQPPAPSRLLLQQPAKRASMPLAGNFPAIDWKNRMKTVRGTPFDRKLTANYRH